MGLTFWLLIKLGTGKWEMGNAEMKKRGDDLEMVDYCIHAATADNQKQKQTKLLLSRCSKLIYQLIPVLLIFARPADDTRTKVLL